VIAGNVSGARPSRHYALATGGNILTVLTYSSIEFKASEATLDGHPVLTRNIREVATTS